MKRYYLNIHIWSMLIAALGGAIAIFIPTLRIKFVFIFLFQIEFKDKFSTRWDFSFIWLLYKFNCQLYSFGKTFSIGHWNVVKYQHWTFLVPNQLIRTGQTVFTVLCIWPMAIDKFGVCLLSIQSGKGNIQFNILKLI